MRFLGFESVKGHLASVKMGLNSDMLHEMLQKPNY